MTDPNDPSTAGPDVAPAGPPPAGPPVPSDPPPPGLRSQPASSGGVPRALVAILAPVLAVVMFAGGLAVGRSGPAAEAGPTATATVPTASGADAGLALIEQAWHDIQDNYVDAKHLDNQALAYAAIGGITNAVGDTGHTYFETAAAAKAQDQELSGTFVGIGVTVADGNGNGIIVGSVIPHTPAEAAGLKRGDRVIAVNGKSTAGQTTDQIVQSIRGPEGQAVTLTVQRAGVAGFDVTIVRRKFDLPLISWAMVPGRKVAMVRLEQFATGANKALQDALTAAKAAGATAIVFDLRGNPGGYVNEAVGVASQFIADGTVYRSVDASGTTKDVPIEPGGLATDIPLVVLADGQSASGAEIVAGAIQDAGRAKLVGEKTLGTGTVLGRFDLADGSVLRIGVERWLTRSGRPIWHEGLVPDVTVALPTTATLVVPDNLRDMTAGQVAASDDAQLLKGLDLLVGKG
jgi:carboxyl-terminal processing protease